MKKALSLILALVMMLSMSVTAFADGDEKEADDPKPGTGSAFIPGTEEATTELITEAPKVDGDPELNNFHDAEVNVSYLTPVDRAVADKTYLVQLDYTFPASLWYNNSAKYNWDAESKKYVKGEDSSTEDGDYELTNDGRFEIILTNMSNVMVDYEVKYTPDDGATFVSTAEYNDDTNTGSVATIASDAYQDVGAENVKITDATAALAGEGSETPYPTATCSGTLTVSGLAESQTADPGKTYKLGTFRVTIMEHADTSEVTTVNDILGKDFPESYHHNEDKPDVYWRTNDKQYEQYCFKYKSELTVQEETKMYVFTPLDAPLKEVTGGYAYDGTYDNGSKSYSLFFQMESGKLVSITFTSDDENLNGVYLPLGAYPKEMPAEEEPVVEPEDEEPVEKENT